MNLHPIRSTVGLLLLAALLPAQMSGNYTIDPKGTGTRNFKDFSSAIYQLFQQGVNGPVTLSVVPGTYKENWTIVPIAGLSKTNKLTIQSQQQQKAILEAAAGTGDILTMALATTTKPLSWIVIDGFVFGKATRQIYSVTPTSDIELKNCRFRKDASSYQVYIGSAERWNIHHNLAIMPAGSSRYWSIVYATDSDIHHNDFRVSETLRALRLFSTDSKGSRIYNNLFTGKLSTSTNAAALDVGSTSLQNLEIAHNTFVIETVRDTQGCIRVGGVFTRAHKLYSNIFTSTGVGSAMVVMALNSYHYEMDGNLYFAAKSQKLIQVDRGSSYATLKAWQTASSKDQKSIQADPQFVNTASPPAGLKLKSTSPAIGKAVNTPKYVTDDFEGKARSPSPDIGAYENPPPIIPFKIFGKGCAGTFGNVPVLGYRGTPALGSKDFVVTLSNALGGSSVQTFFAIGLSNQKFGGGTLPFPFGGGCNLLVSTEFILRMAMAGSAGPGNGTQQVKFAIPNKPGLKGAMIHFQWAVIDPAAKGIGLAFSNGGTLSL